jgi:hypothetical protein
VEKIFFKIQMPVDDDNKLIVAASITQAAAAIYAAQPRTSQYEAVTTAFLIYQEVVERLQEAEQLP